MLTPDLDTLVDSIAHFQCITAIICHTTIPFTLMDGAILG